MRFRHCRRLSSLVCAALLCAIRVSALLCSMALPWLPSRSLAVPHAPVAPVTLPQNVVLPWLLSKEPLFKGKREFDQLDKIFKIFGTPSETIWPGFSKLPGVKVNFVKYQLLTLGGSGLAIWLFLRITAEAALNHE
ncbi:cyclin-dependent kinase G-2-like [Arachis hypogaea]|uniref:cyclin-dependent kinase G-2-like n=1 Tax=Arachis hypogaea TaxID=3818 RepID=UPI003B226E9A